MGAGAAQKVPPLPDEKELRELMEGVGTLLSDHTITDEWPIGGFVHPVLTCLTGPPETGKTTVLQSFCRALIDGAPWLGRDTHLSHDRRILFGCETPHSASRVAGALNGTGPGSGRVFAFPLVRFTALTAGHMRRLVSRTSAGVLIIDSVFAAAGDVNEQERAALFTEVTNGLDIPVVAVHHTPKGGRAPSGAQMFTAAYRHTVTFESCTPAGNAVVISLTAKGNDAPPATYKIRVDRDTLQAELVQEHDDSERGATATQRDTRRRPRTLTDADRAEILGRLCADAGVYDDGKNMHNTCATRLLGGGRGREDPQRKTEVAARLSATTVGHKRLSDIIKAEPGRFRAGRDSARAYSQRAA